MTQGKLLQASCIAVNGHAILIEGEPGRGKSSLALALIDRGAVLIGDDGVEIERQESQLIASPPPNITGKLEIRHVGIVELPVMSAPLALAVELIDASDAAPQRFHASLPRREFLGVPTPYLALPAHDYTLPLRVEWALRLALSESV